ncbi:hypothetical protein HFK74_19485|uniref:hypothetical protein n=1 Tax=Pseudomonas sp. SbOxS1 TaxID=2723884 RepID=UPI0015D2588F|nr:hypothetical protein [Pseudomonas sp. SbOxS1]NYU04880.1 hypothetical protein [Pseudomonas sp. SbOxS1]
MPELPEKLTFKAWQRCALFERAQKQGPRLGGKLALTLTDSNTAQQATEDARFTLIAAADVAGLKSSAIKHMAPAPFARDAETTKLVHIDLWEYDLPWRYTPQVNMPNLPPWLVLLVGTTEEIQVDGALVTRVDDKVLIAHNLAESHLWAHTQWDGHTTVGRIVSPRGLETNGGPKPVGLMAQQEYIAVLVPAFNDAGQLMWNAPADRQFGTKGVLPAFHSWRFWTAESGDFETLATALHMPEARDVGKANLHYRRKSVGIDETLEVRGAITSLQQPETQQQDQIDKVQADLALITKSHADTIGLPQYGRPWLPNPEGFGAGWPHELNNDPRLRGTAGLGVWMGVEAQEALMDAAVAQAGALREAGQRIGHLAMGLQAASSLWDRRLPADKNQRLRLFGPLMSRMVAADGGIVLDRVTSGSSPLVQALFSSAAQRILRDRSATTRHVADTNGGINCSAALDEANQPERQPERAPAGLPHVDAIIQQMGLPTVEEMFELDERWLNTVMEKLDEIVRFVTQAYREKSQSFIKEHAQDDIPGLRKQLAELLFSKLRGTLQNLLEERELPCEADGIVEELGDEFGVSLLIFCELVMADEGARQRLHDSIRRAIRQCLAKRRCRAILAHVPDIGISCDDLLDNMPSEPRPEQKPIDLGRLSDTLFGALDPRKPSAPARIRLCSQLEGIDCTRLIPPEFPIGLDFPTWGLLSQYDKEWLLPGASMLEKDSITALQTNPTFIDAFMVGINTQFISEMRWRDLAVTRTCTPLRMFWGPVNYATHKRQGDIQPLGEWAKVPADPIGALSHQSIQPHDVANANGSRLVLTFRSDLFRRYPSTLVYLVKPGAGDNVDELLKSTPQLDMLEGAPDGVPQADIEKWRRDRKFFGPIFAGTLTPELTFFTFDVAPSDIDLYWLVLDEPPAELRFRNVNPDDKPLTKTNAATFAQTALDQPTRVAISGKELNSRG